MQPRSHIITSAIESQLWDCCMSSSLSYGYLHESHLLPVVHMHASSITDQGEPSGPCPFGHLTAPMIPHSLHVIQASWAYFSWDGAPPAQSKALGPVRREIFRNVPAGRLLARRGTNMSVRRHNSI